VRTALKALKVPAEQTIMPWDGTSFDAKGQNTGARGVVQQLIGGKYRVVFPADYATTDAVWPMSKARQK
jgi:branched-chain amino acid transport system substrate-binding protein